jgi:hypothetical protein
MKNYIICILIFTSTSAFCQSWIAGDTIAYLKVDVSTQYLPNTKVVFDIDCDGLEDVNINSVGPGGIGSPWSRLSFVMQDDVECVMLNPGFITAFEVGDTVPLFDETIYEENLDYICGNGAAGGYGQCNLQEKYLVFRKKTALDTNYMFIWFSNLNVDFTIHHVISSCAINPISVVLSSEEVFSEKEALVFPNPTNGIIKLRTVVDELKLYNLNGRMIFNRKNAHQEIDVTHLNSGVYIMELSIAGKKKRGKFIKK